MPYFLSPWIAACLLLICHSACATCKVKAIFIQPPSEAPEKAVLVVGRTLVDIDLPRRNLSDAVELEPGQVPITVLPQRPTGPDIPQGAPKFTIPESWTSCILLFFHNADNTVFPAHIIPVNTTSMNFPLGHILLFNASNATVAARLGTEAVKVLPGKSMPVKPPRTGSGAYPVAIDCALPGDGKPIALCRSTWQHEANARQILFIVPQPGQRIPRIWGVLERDNTNDTNLP